MLQDAETRREILLDPQFFCDGPYYLLTSASLGGGHYSPEALAETLGGGEAAEIETLLRQGICLPLWFEGDCALDNNTLFVLGDLTADEEHDWIGRLAGKLNIPCGKLVLLCGGGDAEELTQAISGDPPEPNYQIFQTIEVPPGNYLVEVYAYLSSMTVQMSLDRYDEHLNSQEDEALKQWYEANRPGKADIGYIIRLAPLEAEPPLPQLDPEMGWCGVFEFREPEC